METHKSPAGKNLTQWNTVFLPEGRSLATAGGTVSGFTTYTSKDDEWRLIKARRRRDIPSQAMKDTRVFYLKRYRVLHTWSLAHCFYVPFCSSRVGTRIKGVLCNEGSATDKRKVEEHTNLGSVRLFPLAVKPPFRLPRGPVRPRKNQQNKRA